MLWVDVVPAAVSPYVTAGIGLAGSLIGGGIAGWVSLVLGRQGREAAAVAWIRQTRHETYDRFLSKGQELLVACEDLQSDQVVKDAFSGVFEAYGVVQYLGERPVVDAARTYAYRLMQLRWEILGDGPPLVQWSPADVAGSVRDARHGVIDAIRTELEVAESMKPARDFNPFEETDVADRYRELHPLAETDRPVAGR
jgi:xanthosine utilization system XapX-like protein